MSYCPKCGSRFEKGAFRCPQCGSPLAYEPQKKGPPLGMRLAKYRNPLILLALAVVILMTRTAVVVTSIYWIIIAGLIAALLFRVLKNWREKKAYQQFKQNKQPRHNNGSNLSGYGPPRNYVPKPMPKGRDKKPANVIPFRKKRDPKSKAKPD